SNVSIENVDKGEPKPADDAQKQDEDGLNNENDEQERLANDSSSKDVNDVGQQVNTASLDVNTGSLELNAVGPSVSTASSNEEDSIEEEPEVDLGNIINSYIVPTTPNTRIHKDHPIDNVIGEVQSTIQTRRMSKSTSEQGFLSDVYEQKIHDTQNTCLYACFLSQIEPTSIAKALSDSSWVEAMQEELLAFLYVTIEEEVYVTQPPGFKDPDHPNKVYKDGDADELMERFQVTPKTSHLLAVKRIFRYLKSKPTLGLWYYRDSPFELVAYTDSDYARATLDRKSTTGGCQFLGNRLISWQCKKQTVVATSTTEAEYVAAASCCGQVGDEAVHKELGDRMERAATSASSLEAEQDSGNIK
ncbi:hypothetical protein Tco_0918313, partial [Tanacetum coccineum]